MPPILNGRPTQLPSHENRLFPNATGLKIAANVFFPENFDESKQYPAILVGHPAGGVKEQTAGPCMPNVWPSWATSPWRLTQPTRAKAKACRRNWKSRQTAWKTSAPPSTT